MKDLLGLTYSLDEIASAPAGSEISRDMKRLKEVRERAGNLHKSNKELEDQVRELKQRLETSDLEN